MYAGIGGRWIRGLRAFFGPLALQLSLDEILGQPVELKWSRVGSLLFDGVGGRRRRPRDETPVFVVVGLVVGMQGRTKRGETEPELNLKMSFFDGGRE